MGFFTLLSSFLYHLSKWWLKRLEAYLFWIAKGKRYHG